MTPLELKDALSPLCGALNNIAEAIRSHSTNARSATNKTTPNSNERKDSNFSYSGDSADKATPRGPWCDVSMSFGKHKGTKLSLIPETYLDWLLEKHEKGEITSMPLMEGLDNYMDCKKGNYTNRSTEEPSHETHEVEEDDDNIPF